MEGKGERGRGRGGREQASPHPLLTPRIPTVARALELDPSLPPKWQRINHWRHLLGTVQQQEAVAGKPNPGADRVQASCWATEDKHWTRPVDMAGADSCRASHGRQPKK